MIPVFQPLLTKKDKLSVLRSLNRGEISGNFGKSINLFEKNFSKYIGSKYAVGVANATDGIELIMNAHNIKRNDEVITVSHTATGTISAILSSGAKPVLNDINENYLFDCSNFMKLVTKKTKAVIIVHIYGQACDFRSIINYCKKKKY